MRYDAVDRILSNEQQIIPSAGFIMAVMGAVRGERAVPPPIPFPWRRALPGALAAILALVALCNHITAGGFGGQAGWVLGKFYLVHP
ncbi:MAG: hypothetical protein DMG92_18030 [Acidobacteria bacterium]|nr:MAG: hypothetical protein DMG92_18030 [Acidobacteriota bacterium]